MKILLIVVGDTVFLDKARDRVVEVAREELSSANIAFDVAFTPNDRRKVQMAVLEAVQSFDAIVVAGGSGPSPRDVSVEAVKPLFDKELEGLGEVFRRLSEKSVGLKAYLSRATAGTIGDTLVFVVPGSPDAVRLALREIVAPILEEGISAIRGESHWKTAGVTVKSSLGLEDALVAYRRTASEPHPLYAQVLFRGVGLEPEEVERIVSISSSEPACRAWALVSKEGSVNLVINFAALDVAVGLDSLVSILKSVSAAIRTRGQV